MITIAAISSAISAALNLLIFKTLTEIVKEQDAGVWYMVFFIAVMATISAFLNIYVGKYVTNHFEMKVTNYRKVLSERVIRADYQKT